MFKTPNAPSVILINLSHDNTSVTHARRGPMRRGYTKAPLSPTTNAQAGEAQWISTLELREEAAHAKPVTMKRSPSADRKTRIAHEKALLQDMSAQDLDCSLTVVTTPSSTPSSTPTDKSRGHSREESPVVDRLSWEMTNPRMSSGSPHLRQRTGLPRASSVGNGDWPSTQVPNHTQQRPSFERFLLFSIFCAVSSSS